MRHKASRCVISEAAGIITQLEPALDANVIFCIGRYMLGILLRFFPMSFEVSLDRSGNNDRFRNDTCNLLSLGAMHCIDRLPI
jgi:hypothetical protein